MTQQTAITRYWNVVEVDRSRVLLCEFCIQCEAEAQGWLDYYKAKYPALQFMMVSFFA